MNELLRWTGRMAGAVGVLLCLVSCAARVAGVWTIAGFQIGTMLQGGIAAMVLACLAYLVILAERVDVA
jgi:hypothetical protein